MTQTVALISRALHALRTSLQRDGVVGTLKKGPKLVRYVRRRIKDADYHRRYWAIEREEGFDQKYGTDTSKMVETFELGAAGPNAKQAVRYEPAHVRDVLRALSALDIDHRQFTLVDLGSGKARTLMLAARYPFRKLVGVEFASALHAVAQANVEKFKASGESGEFELHCLDAAQYDPPPGDFVYYLFNPFGEPVMRQVVERLVASLKQSPRKAALLYTFPAHRAVLESTGLFKPRREDERFTLFTNW